MVGRQDALSALQAHLSEVRAGSGRVVIISGEAGLGKTRLTHEFLDVARSQVGVDSVVGHCFDSDTSPYSPFVHAVSALRRLIGADFEELLGGGNEALRSLLGESTSQRDPLPRMEPSHARRRLHGEIIHTLGTLRRRQARIVVLEDLHWADATSRDLFTEWARVINTEPVLLIGTVRREVLEHAHPMATVIATLIRERRAAEIVLRPLERAETARFLEVTLEQTIPKVVVTLLHDRASGNPFFLEEILRSLIEQQQLDQCLRAAAPAALFDQLEVPVSIRLSILGHVAELDAPARDVVSLAAALGRTFDFDVLRALSSLPEVALAAALEQGIEHQLIAEDRTIPGERYHFRHALTREAIYGSLSGRERLMKHRVALAHFETLAESEPEAYVEALAYHSLRAGDTERAGRYAQLAGDRAMRLYAYREALVQYETALSLAARGEPARRAELHAAIAGALRLLRRYLDYVAHWREARTLYATSGDLRREAAVCLDLAAAAWEGNETREAFATAEAAIELLERAEAPPCELANAHATMARLHVLSSHAREIATWGERALELAHACGDERMIAGIMISLGVGRHFEGAHEEAIALLRDALAMAERSGSWFDVGRAYNNLCDCYFFSGDYSHILELYAAHSAYAERTGWEHTVPAMLHQAARAHLELGHLDESASLHEELVAVSQATMPTVVPLAIAGWGTLRVRQGRAGEAVKRLEEVVHVAERDGSFEKIDATMTALMQARLALGDLEGAATLARRGIAQWRPLGPVVGSERFLLAAAEALYAVGDSEAAAEGVTALEVIAARSGSRVAEAACLEAHGLRAEAGSDPTTAQLWSDAAQAWERLAMPYQAARARNRAAEAPALSDGRVSSPVPLGCPLTPRELEVVATIAQGANTLQIAHTLVVSEHTVHRHVANILAKLAVPTRAAAVALAAQQGWLESHRLDGPDGPS
jgi:DNA-binding CsgD family transcriptional regulator/tetratricopeptide (TPR) repeat protein